MIDEGLISIVGLIKSLVVCVTVGTPPLCEADTADEKDNLHGCSTQTATSSCLV
jgi:hypothetical protein